MGIVDQIGILSPGISSIKANFQKKKKPMVVLKQRRNIVCNLLPHLFSLLCIRSYCKESKRLNRQQPNESEHEYSNTQKGSS